MPALLHRGNQLLDVELRTAPRICLVVAALLLGSIYLLPLWNLTMFAPQYPDGLRLDIYAFKLEGGNGGQDVKEINLLNHYIGMRELTQSDFTEFKWMPFVIGVLALVFLRAAVMGRMAHLVDAFVIYMYFAAFSLGSFAYKLYRYGHDLAPSAAVRVKGFTPPIFGHRHIANFDVYSYPKPATYMLTLAAAALMIALVFGWRGRNARTEA
jgi:hypothetical protein